MIGGLGEYSLMKLVYVGYLLLGIQFCLMDVDGKELEGNDIEGLFCVKYFWLFMLWIIYGDYECCCQIYFFVFENFYFIGDGVCCDKDGMYCIIGCVDDVINVFGYCMGIVEVENVINEYEFVVELVVVGYLYDIKGQGIYVYVIVFGDIEDEDVFCKELIQVVVKEIGLIVKFDKIQIVFGLLKICFGKIMCCILCKVVSGDMFNLGDIFILFNLEVVDEIKDIVLV